MSYCTQCGASLPDGPGFCTQCGTRANGATTSPTPPSPAEPPQAASSHTLRNLIVGVTAVLLLVVFLGIAGALYVGIKVKQKASGLADKVTLPTSVHSLNSENAGNSEKDRQDSGEQPLNALANLLQGKQDSDKGDDVPTISKSDPVVPCTSGTMPSQDGARIPLRKGTVVTTAWGIKKGDVEVRNTVTSADNTGFTDISLNGAYVDDNGQNVAGQSDTNTVCSEDLREATAYTTQTWQRLPQILHGLTRLRLSDKTFYEICTTGHTHLASEGFWPVDEQRLAPMLNDGDLVRTEKQDVAYPLIVNDQRVTLPAIHLTGFFDVPAKDPRPMRDRPAHVPTELYVLDDPLDPLVLLLKMTTPQYYDGKFRIEVTSVTFEVPHPINLVEKQLTEQKRAVTYGIYFDFNKDTIKPESEPVLKQIVQAMTDNPTWKLTVAGHTDNIGGDAYNLDLSKRRAAAVKRALVDRYHIAPDRLITDGYGALRPVDTNETLEGRARNRRVELTRE
jgi:outer membrane protein OmpA-like peptidoglycan-associated protein